MTNRHPRTFVRLAFTDTASLAYLCLVAAISGIVAYDLVVTRSSGGLVGVRLFFVTLPTSLVLLAPLVDSTSADPLSLWTIRALLLVSALVQSLVIGAVHGAITEVVRERRRRSAP
ncbi:SCO4225 family membrane protein [Streptomyces sp. NPDC059352]|uniref:SCO4225 family membrane protein n=1 Tax=Streptomyces sp. NPDC059352 TaxID=3346810 RepID=UPI0036D1703B